MWPDLRMMGIAFWEVDLQMIRWGPLPIGFSSEFDVSAEFAIAQPAGC